METTTKNTEIQKRNKYFKLFPVLFSIVVALLLLCSELDDERGDTVGIVVAFLFVSCLLVHHGCVLMQKDKKKPIRIMLVR
jgi:phosphatidylserine synthase